MACLIDFQGHMGLDTTAIYDLARMSISGLEFEIRNGSGSPTYPSLLLLVCNPWLLMYTIEIRIHDRPCKHHQKGNTRQR